MGSVAEQLAEKGIHADRDGLHLMPPDQLQQSVALQEECREFLSKTKQFNDIVGDFIDVMESKSKVIEAEKLRADGITRIGQLQAMDKGDLMARYHAMGERLWSLARGIDRRKVDPHHDMKSISAETTFNQDLATLDDLAPVLRALSEKVSARLKAGSLAGRTVVLKLKTSDFRARTRNRQLADPTQLADRIFSNGLDLLKREIDGTRFRLIGIGVADLESPDRADPADLVDPAALRRARAENAVDALRARFGGKAVETGYTFGRDSRARPQRDQD